jgi:hypothetical protein
MSDLNKKAAITAAMPALRLCSRLDTRLGSLLFLPLLLIVPAKPGLSQANGGGGRIPVLSGQGGATGAHQTLDYENESPGAFDSAMLEKRMKMLNDERHKSLVSDSDKLFKLATELNNEIARSSTGSLTPEQLRKVAEIEKLAHNVRDKMTQTLSGPKVTYFPITGSQ